MSKIEQYRRNAEDAQRQADRATSDEVRAAWLDLVQGWLALLPKRDLSRDSAQYPHTPPPRRVALTPPCVDVE
jgi:hypothetical protein